MMAPRQWRGLRRWLGESPDFQDPKYDVIGARFAAWPQISELVAALFAPQTMKELVAAGQAHGVPIAAVLTPSRILASEHFQAVGAITEAELVPGVHTKVPTGYFVVNEQRAGFHTPAPAVGQDQPRWLADPAPELASTASVGATRSKGCGFSIWASSSRGRAEPAVRRPGRRGHQGRKRRLPRRATTGPCR
ncbi:acyl-CoA transferase/dehydratase domain protein [Mycobacterium ulcerans str. Harvey]|uniref:Acyl-CoA transferase/dehydratase domain protein n=1 Tax=Mycobacterium ulcerans str. Harvey TaxID=1299332 RepID=A0ABP3AD08_MYCUL|nr:acyl-CoA transferase/dehydratase domain protein [Mycobacterium ulcerans str. Harvey]